MKKIARILALLLACLTCVLTAVACQQDETEDPTGGGNDLSGNTVTQLLAVQDSLPRDANGKDTLNYGGETITVLHWNEPWFPEFDEEMTGENLADSVFQRNLAVTSRLNIGLDWIGAAGDSAHVTNFVQRVESTMLAGTHEFDIIASYSRSEAQCAARGYLVNLNNIGAGDDANDPAKKNYIELSKPWWPPELMDTISLGSSLYMASGDASPNVIASMMVMYTNKDLINQNCTQYLDAYNSENGTDCQTAVDMLYQMVYKGQWTYDEMIRICTGIYQDDNSGVKDEGDKYGFATVYSNYIETLCTSANIITLLPNDDDLEMIKISSDYTSRKLINLITKLGAWFQTDDVYYTRGDDVEQKTADTWTRLSNMFKAGKAMFMNCEAYTPEIRDWGNVSTLHYGVMPYPKYNTQQKNYYTPAGNTSTIYGIFVGCTTRDMGGINNTDNRARTLSMMSAILECWSGEGFHRTTPEVYYVNMMLRYSEGQDDSNMFEYCRSSILFDLGRIFGNSTDEPLARISDAIVSNSSWASRVREYYSALEARVAELNANLYSYLGNK